MNIYDLTISTPQGKTIGLADYKGKYILVVNTATQCALNSQFEELEQLHQEISEDDLVVLGFPCDQFGDQEPENNETVQNVCLVNHGVTFQLTEKIDVNGRNAHPLFKLLQEETSSLFSKKIKWNFTKFLIGPEGNLIKRYSPVTRVSKVEKDIKKLLPQYA